MVSGPRHETTQGRPATAIRIPGVPVALQEAKSKPSPRRRNGRDASTDRGLTERSGEVFSLDILSHRMSEMGTLRQLPPRDLGPAQHFGTLQSERSWTNNHPRCAAMRRFLPILLVLALQVLASETSLAQAQTLTSNDGSSEEVPRDSVPQNTPCVGQPKSRRELAASFQQGRLPEASEITGTWVANRDCVV